MQASLYRRVTHLNGAPAGAAMNNYVREARERFLSADDWRSD